jgi:hypothetical protein
MKVDFDYKATMIKYLLKELSEAESIEFEEQYFENQDLFEQLLVVEDELIDDYVRGVLPKEIKERFEKYFLTTPKRQQRVEFARVLLEKVDVKETTNVKTQVEEKQNFWQNFWQLFYDNMFVLRWSLITTGFVLSIVFLQIYIKRVDQRSKDLESKQISPVNLQPNKGLKGKDQKEKSKEQPPKTEPNLTAKEKGKDKLNQKALAPKNTDVNSQAILLSLYPSVRGDAGLEPLHISPEKTLANIQLNIDPQVEYKKYFVVLTRLDADTGSNEIWKQVVKVTKSKGTQFIFTQIPTKLLKPADYGFTIFSLPNKDQYQQSYSFSVTK